MSMVCPVCDEQCEIRDGRLVHHGECVGSFARPELAETNLESRYTDGTPMCPHPERWHAQDWDSAEDEVGMLVAAFVRGLQPDLVVETGSAFGHTAHKIGRALLRNGQGVLHTIEIDADRAEETRKQCDELPVVVEQMSSLEWTPPGEIGFAWFDSLIDLRVPEFKRYYPFIRKGAIVGFHDTNHPGLWAALEGLEDAGSLLPIRLPTPRGAVFAEVT